jgi:hypothetical protein
MLFGFAVLSGIWPGRLQGRIVCEVSFPGAGYFDNHMDCFTVRGDIQKTRKSAVTVFYPAVHQVKDKADEIAAAVNFLRDLL